ncbi:hypothetical protein NBRGN_026_00710 [Nocardia brasiliensis NBRC 14402]|uniref:hypothetical protein n=1 Tax=Nocardia brasiliensis TaxID=37326 RepID=UPI0002D3B5BB|nr:hypothetical protein [Nocardia brasiliensis]ASF08996.1 hypothetical protein CEQ30_18320 [Nocardia brasiliensis]GAJ80318.1 hypothetical protein NBRGN_026_00710 [Nocardia brasiliensis NBRC 14402]SUB40394.1 Uncharacterised protein [Nocardia brasiliensis]
MSAVEIGCFALAATMVVLRLTRWRSVPQSRPFTVALTLLVLGVALRRPEMLDSSWLDSQTAADIHLANFTDLLGDLLVATAACYIGILVARAWGLDHVVPWIARGVAGAVLLMVVLWSISNAPTTPVKFVGNLGGPATAYSYVAATTGLLAHLAIVLTIVVVRVPAKMRVALLALGSAALLGVVSNALRIASHLAQGEVAAARERVDWPISLTVIVLYSVAGLIGYLMTAPKRARRGGHDRPGHGPAPATP